MKRITLASVVFLILSSPGFQLFAQTTIQSPLQVVGKAGEFRMKFGISDKCSDPTSTPGTATLCGNNGTVVLSINGASPFALQPVPPPVVEIGPPGPPGQTGATGSQGPPGLPGVIPAPIDYALVTHPGMTYAGSISWTMPGGVSELFGGIVRAQADLRSATQARVYVEIGSNYEAIGSVFYLEYAVPGFSKMERGPRSWTMPLDPTSQMWFRLTQDADVSSEGSHVSKWATIPSLAKGDVVVRAVSSNGTNGKIDILAVHLQVK
jgi:hypothetical protein